MAGFLNRARAARLMREAQLDALVLMQPETVRWASGADPGVAASWRRAGAAAIIAPADPAAPLAAVVGDLQALDFQARSGIERVRTHPIWVETSELSAADRAGDWRAALAKQSARRPTTFDARQAIGHISELLGALAKSRIGVEESFLSVADARLVRDALPGATLIDCSSIVQRLRIVKHSMEIEWLTLAASAAETGLRALLAALRVGMTTAEMTRVWREAALAEAARLGAPQPVSAWAYIAVGEDGFAPGGPARPGDIIKIDVGCVVNGYSSDGARTVVLGEPSPIAASIHHALLDAFLAARGELKPGAPLSRIHARAMEAMRDAGFPGYSRGHFGHSCGASIWSEEWPFIGADEPTELEAGMVIALETPWYVRGVGGFIIEDQFALTDRGAKSAWTLPHELIALPA